MDPNRADSTTQDFLTAKREMSEIREQRAQIPSSLRLKTILSIFIAALLVGSSGITFFLVSGIFRRFEKTVRDDLAWKASQIPQELLRKAEIPMAVGDSQLVAKAMRRHTQMTDVLALLIIDAAGRSLARHGPVPADADALFRLNEGTVGEAASYLWSWDAARIEGREVGRAVVLVSKLRLQEGNALRQRMLLIASAGCLVALMASFIFVGGYLGPLLRFAETTLRKLQELNGTLEKRVDDRTVALVQANGKLTETLEQNQHMQRQLMDASRRAGMADVATTVLHNVGNVLNSVNVSAGVVRETVLQSRANGLFRVAELLRAQGDDVGRFLSENEKGRRLPPYLCQLADAVAEERKTIESEVDNLQKNVEHIRTIVSRQQSQAKQGVEMAVIEQVALSGLLDDALQSEQAALEKRGLVVTRDYGPTPAVFIDRHKVLQILINLISNARHAVVAQDGPTRNLTLRLRPGTPGRILIEVEDSGCGIAPENLQRVFAYGFTTKADGHGFGLHSSACAAVEMGGGLVAASEGPGLGACFTLTLPLTPPIQDTSSSDLPAFVSAAT